MVEQSLLLRHQLELPPSNSSCNWPNLPRLQCDPSQIEQVLLAVIVNAADAMPKGGNLWITTTFNARRNQSRPHRARRRLRHPAGNHAAIFEPFVTTKENGHGMGLGLAISRGIMERHSGKIEVQSEVGKGTTVTITLPVRRLAPIRTPRPGRTKFHATEVMTVETQGKLLIVDDELSVRDSLAKWFHEEGYEVGTAENANGALTRMAEKKWDARPARHQDARHRRHRTAAPHA